VLAEGWELSLRCASEGLGVEQRSDRWRAVAEDGSGSAVEGEGDDPIAALADLRARVRGDAPRAVAERGCRE